MEKYIEIDMVYVAKGGFWWLLGRICIFLITLGTMAAFANLVSKETYGAYRYILSVMGILAIFTLPGMDTALIRAVAKGYEKMIFPCAKSKFFWALIGSGICFIISIWYFFYQNFPLGISFLIAGIFLPFYNTFSLFLYFWQGKKRFDIQSQYLILYYLLITLVLIPVIFLTDNLILIVFVYFLAQTLFGAIFFKLTLRKISNQNEEKETVSFGKHLTLMGSAVLLGEGIDKIIIWHFLGSVAVAIYSFAQIPILRIRELIPIFPLALPKLSEKNLKEIKKGIFEKFLKLFFFSIPFALFFILISPYLYKILFPAYSESIPYFQVLSLILILAPFSLLGTSLVAEMKKKELYIIQFATPFLQIILFLVLIPFYGIWGAIFAILISQIFNGGLVLYFFKKI
ncbi:MAG: oligosaccharide flippase family protein [Patescibacteria group bacterium]|nr:oligosaccharide flippase family protein [Patescibacteria group bacterium]